MTTAIVPAAPTSPPSWRSRQDPTVVAVASAVVAGIALGAGDLAWMLRGPGGIASLADSSAVWAFATFLLGAALAHVLRLDVARSAAAGVVMLVVAVETYYAAAALWLGDEWSNLWSPVSTTWMLFAVLAGAVFAPAGACAVGPSSLRVALGTALGAAVLLGEALHVTADVVVLGRLGAPQNFVVGLTLLGLITLLTAARRPLALVGAVGACVPLTLLVAAGFSAAGIAY